MNHIKIIHKYLDTFLDFIYPRNIYCILCGEPIQKWEEYSVCKTCKENIPFILLKRCNKCGKPLENLYLPDKCPDCIREDHFFTSGFSCVVYDDVMKKLVYGLKYNGKRYLSYHMAEMMVDKLRKEGLEKIDLVVPVPIHKKRERARGFNQAYLLAKYIGRAMDWKVDGENFIRKKNTPYQNKLMRGERKKNLKGAFQVVSNEVFCHKNILLVDDVYTTGSTMDTCSKELLKAKPKGIYCITFATGRNVGGNVINSSEKNAYSDKGLEKT